MTLVNVIYIFKKKNTFSEYESINASRAKQSTKISGHRLSAGIDV